MHIRYRRTIFITWHRIRTANHSTIAIGPRPFTPSLHTTRHRVIQKTRNKKSNIMYYKLSMHYLPTYLLICFIILVYQFNIIYITVY